MKKSGVRRAVLVYKGRDPAAQMEIPDKGAIWGRQIGNPGFSVGSLLEGETGTEFDSRRVRGAWLGDRGASKICYRRQLSHGVEGTTDLEGPGRLKHL